MIFFAHYCSLNTLICRSSLWTSSISTNITFVSWNSWLISLIKWSSRAWTYPSSLICWHLIFIWSLRWLAWFINSIAICSIFNLVKDNGFADVKSCPSFCKCLEISLCLGRIAISHLIFFEWITADSCNLFMSSGL